MKSYLDLVPITAKIHRRKNRMSVFCIVLAVFLVTVIFGMADMFIRSQILYAKKEGGEWHIGIRKITDEEAMLVSARPEVSATARYGVLNFRGDDGYFLSGKDAILVGCDESYVTDIAHCMTEGNFPQSESEAVVTENAMNRLKLQIGDTLVLDTPGKTVTYTISGFTENAIKTSSEDSYGVFLTTDAFRKFFSGKESNELEDYDSALYVKFSEHMGIQHTIRDLKEQLGFSDDQVIENSKLLGLTGESRNEFMLRIYGVGAILFVLVLIAGIFMITGSINSDVAQRTEFFGMVRCIGATKKQIKKLVRKEAESWCIKAIPSGVLLGVVLIWVLCGVLRVLSPVYFGELPLFEISIPSVVSGVLVGILTVYFAALSPAKRASYVSPLAAVSGNAGSIMRVKRAARTKLFKIDTALGVHHATAGKKNFILMVGSFGISIVLFLSFSVAVDFMHHALTPLRPSAPDISIVSRDEACLVDEALMEELKNHPMVKRAYGRMFAYDVPVKINGKKKNIDLISYETYQFNWAENDLVDGSLDKVQDEELTGACVYFETGSIKVGDTVKIAGSGGKKLSVVGMLSDVPFDQGKADGIIVCSEKTFRELTGSNGYTVIDLQLSSRAQDIDVEEIYNKVGEKYKFSDKRSSNQRVRGPGYSFSMCVYGFLILIAMITVFHIVNSVNMSVSARIKQYGAFRAIGLSQRQLVKMVVAESCSYALTGCMAGCVFGICLNRLMFEILITSHWGQAWEMPWSRMLLIVAVVCFATSLSVYGPIKRIRNLSIVDTINAQ